MRNARIGNRDGEGAALRLEVHGEQEQSGSWKQNGGVELTDEQGAAGQPGTPLSADGPPQAVSVCRGEGSGRVRELREKLAK